MAGTVKQIADLCLERGVAKATPMKMFKAGVLDGLEMRVILRGQTALADDLAGQGDFQPMRSIAVKAIPPHGDPPDNRPPKICNSFIAVTNHCDIDLKGEPASSLMFLPAFSMYLPELASRVQVSTGL